MAAVTRRKNVIAGNVSSSVVDRLEPVEIDHQETVRHARSVDVGPDRPEILLEAATVVRAGERVNPRRELEGVVRPLELEHRGVRPAAQGADPFELGEVPDLGPLEEDVTGEARPKGDEQDDDEVAALVAGKPAARVERERTDGEGRDGEQPADVDLRSPREDESDEAGENEEVADRLDGEARHADFGHHGRCGDAEADEPGDDLRMVAEAPGDRPPAAESERDHGEVEGEGHGDADAVGLESEECDRVEHVRGRDHEEPGPARGPGAAPLDRAEASALADLQVLGAAESLGDRPELGGGRRDPTAERGRPVHVDPAQREHRPIMRAGDRPAMTRRYPRFILHPVDAIFPDTPWEGVTRLISAWKEACGL